MDQEQGDCNVMEYPTKFNKYRRLKEREALSTLPSKDGFSLSNEFPVPSSAQMSNTELIPNTCSTLLSNCTLTPVESRMVLQSSICDSSSAVFATHCQAVDCNKQAERCSQRTDILNQPCPSSNSMIENTHFLSCRLNDVVMKEDEDCEEEEELPLNLTISSAKNLIKKEIQNSPSCKQKFDRTVAGNSNVCSYNTDTPFTQGLTENMIIEEHFQRSLGSNYFKLFDRSSPPVEPSDPILCKTKSAGHRKHIDVMNSVSGSVDDHFSKSLGDVWTKVKASRLPEELDLHPSSVDDHFAKALGEMWYKIQAERDPLDQSNSPHLSPKTCPSSAASSFVHS